MINLPRDIEATVQLLVLQNRKLEAVKIIKDATGCSLKEAKDFADGFDAGQQTFMPPSSGKQIEETLLFLLGQGKKLEAIKHYKDNTGNGLADSKAYIEDLEQQAIAYQQPPVGQSKRDTQIDDILRAQKPQNKSGCFIATACYDDYNAPEVWLLRQYRDERLNKSLTGRLFIKLYYAVSPGIARQLNKLPKTKLFIRHQLLNRLVNRILS